MAFPETVEERYASQPSFKAVVDTLQYYITLLGFTPADMHDAAVLACIRHESIRVRPHIFYVDMLGNVSFEL